MTKVFFTDKCPDFMREAITEMLEQQQKQPEQAPPWRQKGVCVAGHAMFNERPDNECPICGEPTTASGEFQHSPDCEYEKFMMDTIHEQVCHDSRLTGIEERLTAVESWADIHYQPNEAGRYVINNCIHDLIAEGNKSAAALVTVAVAAMDKRADVICKRADLMFEAMQMMTARIEALEKQNALLLNRQAH